MILSLVVSLSCLASAETPATFREMMRSIGEEPTPPAAYEQAEAAQTRPNAVFDGNAVKRDDGLLLLDEKKHVLLGSDTVGGDVECDPPGGCHRTPVHTLRTFGDVRTYRIVDRRAYERSSELEGGIIGGFVGLPLFLLAFLNPVAGVLAGIAAVAAGIGIGAAIGKACADGTPAVFTRRENVRSGF